MTERTRAQGSGSTVSVEEHQALQASHTVLLNQFEAVNEVLSAIGRSAGDADTVLTAIVQSARRLCRGDAAHVYLNEHGVYRLIASTGLSKESKNHIAEHPMPIDRATLIGRVGLDRTTQQIADVLADPDYGAHDLQRVAGFRTTMGAAMVIDDEVVGAMSVWRNEVAPFNEREMDIVTGFAGQAAMAINSIKLVQELQARRAELARKVEELEALRAVGEAVSSSLDVERVLSTVARYAVELSDTDGGCIMEYDERAHSFTVRAVYRTEPEVVERLRTIPRRPRWDPCRACCARASPHRGHRPRRHRARPAHTGSCTTPAGAPWSPCPCCGRGTSSARSTCGASAPGASTPTSSTSWRPSPASPCSP